METLNVIGEKYGKSSNEMIVLDLIQRHNKCDKDRKVLNITGLLLCNLLDKLGIHAKYIYLFAVRQELVSHYRKFGFRSVDVNDPRNMIASVDDLAKSCGDVIKLEVL